jgi:hypothetical protein
LSTIEKGQQNGGGEGAPERRPDQPPLGPGGGLINRHLGRQGQFQGYYSFFLFKLVLNIK